MESCTFTNIPKDVLRMQVKRGSKMKNLIEYVDKVFETKKDNVSVIWTGYGPAVEKVISCAEIMKRNYKLYQITRISYKEVEEHLDPANSELNKIVVKRKLPMINIFLSSKPLDSTELGYQGPD